MSPLIVLGSIVGYFLFKEDKKVKRRVFFSFHYDDVMRVQQVRNIGSIEKNAEVSKNEWEKIKKNKKGVEDWIDNNMKGCSCIVVLIGSKTANRPWVKYEIEKAWNDKKGVVGIYINNLNCPNKRSNKKGKNPFIQNKLSTIVKCYKPDVVNTTAYEDVANNINDWVNEAITIRKKHP